MYPFYASTSRLDASPWDLHLLPDSKLIDAGIPTLQVTDGSPRDIGAFGGAGAADG